MRNFCPIFVLFVALLVLLSEIVYVVLFDLSIGPFQALQKMNSTEIDATVIKTEASVTGSNASVLGTVEAMNFANIL